MAQTIHGRDGITLPRSAGRRGDSGDDNYFGTKITDNYRWLEDAKSPETRAFIDAENAYTARYMKQARIRPQVLDDLDALENVSQLACPCSAAAATSFRSGLPAKNSSPSMSATAGPGKDERLIDPAVLSRDPNTSVRLGDVSRDGTLIAYGVRQGGADETTVHVFNVKTGKTLEDELPSGRYWSVNFTPDGKGLYYARNNKQGTLLYQHVLGTRNSRDTLVFGREFRGEPLGPNDLFSRRRHRRRPLPRRRPSTAAFPPSAWISSSAI